MRRSLLAVALSLGLLVGFPISASAGTLDQQQPTIGTTSWAIHSARSEGQTFTAGISGGLDQADLALNTIGSPTQNLIVEIRDASAAGPGAHVLATQSVTPSSVPASAALVPVGFSPPAPVVAGQQYAIVAWTLAVTPNDYGWHQADGVGDPYPPGTPFTNSTSVPPSGTGWGSIAPTDFAFKTYVVPTPPPTSTGQRAAAVAKCKKRGHKHNWSHKRLKKCKKKANLLPV